MYIIDLYYPGAFLSLENKNQVFEAQNILTNMETALIDMSITLSMFNISQQNLAANLENSWGADRELYTSIEKEYRKQLSSDESFYSNYDYHRSEVEKIYRKEKIKTGEIPQSYKHRIPFIHAHSFLSSTDKFYKFLSVLSNEIDSEHIKSIKQAFEQALPSLREIRNSAQHSEDRSRGYGKPKDVLAKKKINLKPIDNNFIKSDGGVLALSCLNGDSLGYTTSDGTYQEFPISQDTLIKVTELFQDLLNGLTWTGPPSIKPSM